MDRIPGAMDRKRVTEILQAWNRGEEDAVNDLIPLVTDELHQIAAVFMRQERVSHTLQPTALINECYLRLLDRQHVTWNDRSHFFAFVARAMRRILVDHARARQAEKRGGGLSPVTIEANLLGAGPRQIDLIAVDDALNRLGEIDGRLARIVELRVFSGLEMIEIADVLEISKATVHRDWSRARAWLARELRR